MPDFGALLAILVAVIVSTKLFGEIAQRAGQPSVLGELIAGLLLGGSVLGVLDPTDPVIHAFAEIGVLVLLFEIGLHTNLKSLGAVGSSAITVGVVGVLIPFVLGVLVAAQLGLTTLPAIVAGASLTATSIGISARVLADTGQLDTQEGQVVLGAAVLDDVIGLVILTVVSGLVAGVGVTVAGVALTTAVAVGFIIAALVLGSLLVPPIFRAVERVETSGALGLVALAFAFFLAWLAGLAHSAPIIGAFAAGLIFHRTPQCELIERKVTTIGQFFVPFFFASVGAAVDVRTLMDGHVLLIGTALIAVGMLGKFAAGFAPVWFRGSKTLVGIAMIPRGEVGLIFAQMGLASGALDASVFSAITLMVIVTTLFTPPLLARVAAHRRRIAASRDLPGEGGIDDLVSGAAQR